MKLIDLIVKEVPSESVPDAARYVAQDTYGGDTRISFYVNEPFKIGHGQAWDHDSYIPAERIVLSEPADDATFTFLTRAELMEAYDNAQ